MTMVRNNDKPSRGGETGPPIDTRDFCAYGSNDLLGAACPCRAHISSRHGEGNCKKCTPDTSCRAAPYLPKTPYLCKCALMRALSEFRHSSDPRAQQFRLSSHPPPNSKHEQSNKRTCSQQAVDDCLSNLFVNPGHNALNALASSFSV